MVQFLWGLGLLEDEAECYDVYGLDEELLAIVPKPVLAVLFLYPITTQVCLLKPLSSALLLMVVVLELESSRNLLNEIALF